MENEKVIEMLMKQNERLMQIIEAFASKEIIVNSTVNSYNGSSSSANGGTHTQTNASARNIGATGSTGTVNETKM